MTRPGMRDDWHLIEGGKNIPTTLKVGDVVKIGVECELKDPVLVGGERFWVEVLAYSQQAPNGKASVRYVGQVLNHLTMTNRHEINYDSTVEFGQENILALHPIS
jgi:hypothetical protein